MPFESYKDEKSFRENCPCFYTILEFVENEVNTDVRWYSSWILTPTRKTLHYDFHFIR